ncbi:MAG TPA: hypothetical protein VMV46_07000 [Thermoanaerobaculia bacterium]|nr:hypothetical protein [Thermoanaerobaculia bacterium]
MLADAIAVRDDEIAGVGAWEDDAIQVLADLERSWFSEAKVGGVLSSSLGEPSARRYQAMP